MRDVGFGTTDGVEIDGRQQRMKRTCSGSELDASAGLNGSLLSRKLAAHAPSNRLAAGFRRMTPCELGQGSWAGGLRRALG